MSIKLGALAAGLLILSAVGLGGCATGHDGAMDHGAMHEGVMAGDIMASAAWSRPTPPGAPVGAAFLTLSNHGEQPDRLLAATSTVAERVEIHQSSMDQGVMKMRQRDAVAVPAGESVSLQPGGLHLMLMGLKGPLREGDQFDLELQFETAGSLRLAVRVQAMGSDGMEMDHKGHMQHQ